MIIAVAAKAEAVNPVQGWCWVDTNGSSQLHWQQNAIENTGIMINSDCNMNSVDELRLKF